MPLQFGFEQMLKHLMQVLERGGEILKRHSIEAPPPFVRFWTKWDRI